MPDINTLPQTSTEAMASQQMPPPPPATIPYSPTSLNILPSNQSAVNTASASSPQSPVNSPATAASQDGAQTASSLSAATAPVPLRHPRPITASDLHHELEKEQEAVVNRLTRELTLLRSAANASVASNTSSASNPSVHAEAGTPISHEPHPLLSGPSGFTIPSSTGRLNHARTPSSTSIRSASASHMATAGSSTPAGPRANHPSGITIPLSRQSSQQSRPGRSRTGSPAPGTESFGTSLGATSGSYPSSRYPPIMSIPQQQQQQPNELSPGLLPGTRQFEETAFYRAELDTAKRENDGLRRRVRELERALRKRRTSDDTSVSLRQRSESVSTTASNRAAGGGMTIAGPRDGGSCGIANSRDGGRDARSSLDKDKDGGGSSSNAISRLGSGVSISAAAAAAATATAATAGAATTKPDPPPSGPVRESRSTTAKPFAVGVPDDEVKVGESAASRGVVGEGTPARSPDV